MNAEQFFQNKLRYFIGLVGEPGAGKTRQAISFPKTFYVEVGDSYGLKTVLEDPKNASLRPNLIEHVSLDIEDQKEAKDIFRVTDKPEMDSIYGILNRVKQLAAEKKIETLVIDGLSFLFDYKGAQIGKGAGTGDGDRWSYYRQLKTDLTWFVNANVMPLVSRHGLSVVLCLHVQREADEQKQKRTSQDADWAPRIEGSFREAISALPRAMIYLHQKVELRGTEQVVKYYAYCQKVKVPHVGMIPAKNAYGLPPIVDITGRSLHQVLTETMTPKQKQATTTTTAK